MSSLRTLMMAAAVFGQDSRPSGIREPTLDVPDWDALDMVPWHYDATPLGKSTARHRNRTANPAKKAARKAQRKARKANRCKG